jgi:hypothetical protein
MIEVLTATALQTLLVVGPEACMVSFDTANGRFDDLAIECPSLEDQSGAEAEIRRQLEAYGRPAHSTHRTENRVVVFGIESAGEIQWYATSQQVSRIPPHYPPRAAERMISASCAIRMHVSGGRAEVAGSECNPHGTTGLFERANARAIEGWRYTDGLPVFCTLTTLDYSVGSELVEIESPSPPPCGMSDDQLVQLPELIRPFAGSLADLISLPDGAGFDLVTGAANCGLSLDNEGLFVRCPSEAPNALLLASQLEALLASASFAIEQGVAVDLSDTLTGILSDNREWQIEPLQEVLGPTPTLSRQMMNRRSSARCRAGIEVGTDGRAISYELACVTTLNPARHTEISHYVQEQTATIIRNTVWLPPESPTCIVREFNFEHRNPIHDRGVPGTDPDELPDFCEGEN